MSDADKGWVMINMFRLRVAEKNCLEKLNTYKSCLKKYNRSLGNCREQQSAFEECWNSIDG